MIMNLGQAEIETAIIAWITAQGHSLEGKHVTIKLKSGRKDKGATAVVDIDARPVVVVQNTSTTPVETVASSDLSVDAKEEPKVSDDTPENSSETPYADVVAAMDLPKTSEPCPAVEDPPFDLFASMPQKKIDTVTPVDLGDLS